MWIYLSLSSSEVGLLILEQTRRLDRNRVFLAREYHVHTWSYFKVTFSTQDRGLLIRTTKNLRACGAFFFVSHRLKSAYRLTFPSLTPLALVGFIIIFSEASFPSEGSLVFCELLICTNLKKTTPQNERFKSFSVAICECITN